MRRSSKRCQLSSKTDFARCRFSCCLAPLHSSTLLSANAFSSFSLPYKSVDSLALHLPICRSDFLCSSGPVFRAKVTREECNGKRRSHSPLKFVFFQKMGQPRPLLLFIFGLFQTNIITIFTTNICEKVQPVYGAGFLTMTFGT